jgi:uncharacterized Tic20 family protein
MGSPRDTAQADAQYIMRPPSLGERLIAAIAHLLILASLPGIVVTAIIWMISRGSSPYVRHHARAAMRWQFLENVIIFGLIALMLAVILGAGFMGKGANSGNALDAAFAAGIGIILVFAIPTIIFAIPAIFAAIGALFGGNFRYPVGAGRQSAAR